MANIHYTETFLYDVDQIWSPQVQNHLRRVLAMLERFPESGSPRVPDSLKEEFGPDIRKCAIDPFDLVYEYDRTEDTISVLGLMHQKRVY